MFELNSSKTFLTLCPNDLNCEVVMQNLQKGPSLQINQHSTVVPEL